MVKTNLHVRHDTLTDATEFEFVERQEDTISRVSECISHALFQQLTNPGLYVGSVLESLERKLEEEPYY